MPELTGDAICAAQQNPVEASFPIVGVAASAGGLEAFTQLLSHLPNDTGMAFVLIQHSPRLRKTSQQNFRFGFG